MREGSTPGSIHGDGALRIAVLGAECTGKTELVLQLRQAMAEQTGLRVAAVLEYLREWCDRQLRTPARHEQHAIAREQQRRIEESAGMHDIVLCDTTPLMTAIYSQWYFGDDSLDAMAIAAHRQCRITLLTGLDLPWKPDGHQRDGAHVREPIDSLLRSSLTRQGIVYTTVTGAGPLRLSKALSALQAALGPGWPPSASHTSA